MLKKQILHGASWLLAGRIISNALGLASTLVAARFLMPDDFGVVAGVARIELDLAAVDRRFGLSVTPEARPAIEVALPLPIAGSRADFSEKLVEDFKDFYVDRAKAALAEDRS